MKKLSKYLYYIIIIILFLLLEPLINILKIDDSALVVNKALELQVRDLKEEVEMLSNIDYQDYNYILAKISIKNLYDSNVYFLDSKEKFANNLAVINNHGLIGITKENYMQSIKDINLSIRINNNYGFLKNSIAYMDNEVQINDIVYTSGLTSIPSMLKVGTIKECIEKNSKWECLVNINPVDNSYVGVLK